MNTNKITECALYLRISKDDEGTGAGVGRQDADGRELAEELDWTVVRVFTDNDVSATRSRVRPGYRDMLAWIKAGAGRGVIGYEADRITRRDRESLDLLDLAVSHGLRIATVGIGGEYKLTTASGRKSWKEATVGSVYETEKLAERTRRKLKANAAAGQAHSRPAYGWQRDGGVQTLVPDEAAVIRDAARKVLEGQSLRSVARSLNMAGKDTRTRPWTSHLLRQVLLRPSNAGRVVYQGAVLEGVKGQWPAILDDDTHDRIVALLTDPERRTNVNNTGRRHLLSGIAVCGVCGGRMTVLARGRTEARKYQPASYICETGHCVRRNQEKVDLLVSELMIDRLTEPDAMDAVSMGDAQAAADARAEIAAAEAKMALAADQFADDAISAEMMSRITVKMRARISAARGVLETSMPVAVPMDLAGPGAGERWEELALDSQRAVIDVLCAEIRIDRAQTRGRFSFNPDEIVATWRN